ncbi:hypothetical protein ABXN37_29065 [Piscinibacter sakaiensis]|uniref:Uncharacterized protein n=1 Tax=Piscinibacter sakaiensis TaxID=1547922 RepID=A0A0K8PA88_PISS1|nr:hypothetical protein [Piscinibacter sakaiensis]GAP39065.1 hypothetical protein ISF6_0930 [Piscinibacter sakaiensis]
MKLLHALMALALTIALGAAGTAAGVSWTWWFGAGVAAGGFAMREIAQAEYRWIEHHGGGLRSALRWSSIWTTPGIWTEKSWLWDAALPAALAVALAAYGPALLAKAATALLGA